MALKSSRNITADIHAADGGVAAPADAKTGNGFFARVLDAITQSQMTRVEREGRVYLGERSQQSLNRR